MQKELWQCKYLIMNNTPQAQKEYVYNLWITLQKVQKKYMVSVKLTSNYILSAHNNFYFYITA